MNPKIFKYLKLKSELSADDLKQAESLAAMTEVEKQALLEFLGGKAKVGKPAKTRNVEKCGAPDGSTLSLTCGMTRRATVHKDIKADGYHEFQPSKPKSARASSIAGKVAASAKTITAGGNHKAALCSFSIDGKVCHGTENDGIHDATMGYAAYHEFQAETAAAASGD